MNKETGNRVPTAGVDWIYCTSPNESETGYYRPCTVDDENLYTNWQIAETIDDFLGLYELIKVKDPINWESDKPPFEFATPISVPMAAYQFAMQVIKGLNTPYWWGTVKRHNFERGADKVETTSDTWYIDLLRNFWNWGFKTFNRKAWCWFTNAKNADEYTRDLEAAQDWTDELKEKIAKDIRTIWRFFDISTGDVLANTLLDTIDGWGFDILGDDVDFIWVDTSKKDENGDYVYKPQSGVYYIKQKENGKTYYVLWEPEEIDGQPLTWDPEVSYFYKEGEFGNEKKEGRFYFYNADGTREELGLLSYVDGGTSVTYQYYPPNNDKQFKGFNYFKPISWQEAKNYLGDVYIINAKVGKNGDVKVTLPIDSNRGIGDFIIANKDNINAITGNFDTDQKESLKCQYFVYASDEGNEIKDTASNRSIEARYDFWDKMYGLFGSQWYDFIERDTFAAGGQRFLGA
jgi:hypothetical protein